jgi:hypothetical protein
VEIVRVGKSETFPVQGLYRCFMNEVEAPGLHGGRKMRIGTFDGAIFCSRSE